MAMVQFTSWDRSQHLLQQSKSSDKFHDSRWTWRLLGVWLILIWWIRKKPVKSVQSEIRYRSVELFQRYMFNDNLDIMWTVAFHLPQPTPMWSGYMQMLHNKLTHPGKSSDIFLPMIDLTPDSGWISHRDELSGIHWQSDGWYWFEGGDVPGSC